MVLSFAPTVKAGLGDGLERVLKHYRKVLPHPGLSGITFALATERMFRIPLIRVADIQSGRAPVWMYRFDWRSGVSEDLGACHAIELPFVFRTFDSPTSHQIVGPNPPKALSDLMMDAWIAFVRSGSPNKKGLPEWRPYDTTRRATMIFNVRSEMKEDPDAASRTLYRGLLEE